MPSCEAPTAGTGEISRRQRRCGGPGDDQGAPNKAALGGLEASASLGDRSAKLPVTPHRWRWPMACTDGARVGARARLGIGGIGRRSQLGRQGIYAVGVAELLLCSTCSYRPREASCTLSRLDVTFPLPVLPPPVLPSQPVLHGAEVACCTAALHGSWNLIYLPCWIPVLAQCLAHLGQ
nr:uncharacterized protein LOC105472946 isoform X1 [Macaca nemestrina]